ncbi:MAG: hypothetical protein N4A49_16840 [Marinifilaceae bacterium]|jgi:Ca2+/Na+ antiporter|nr:hypothetical protein [Marinifilaceae bacterium]
MDTNTKVLVVKNKKLQITEFIVIPVLTFLGLWLMYNNTSDLYYLGVGLVLTSLVFVFLVFYRVKDNDPKIVVDEKGIYTHIGKRMIDWSEIKYVCFSFYGIQNKHSKRCLCIQTKSQEYKIPIYTYDINEANFMSIVNSYTGLDDKKTKEEIINHAVDENPFFNSREEMQEGLKKYKKLRRFFLVTFLLIIVLVIFCSIYFVEILSFFLG